MDPKGNSELPETEESAESPENPLDGLPAHISRDDYIKTMTDVWNQLVGPDGIHILNADLSSNRLRKNWNGQLRYWMKRLVETEKNPVWKQLAYYLKHFKDGHSIYPDMRSFLKGWRADSWDCELSRIKAYVKGKNADPAILNYLRFRAQQGGTPLAKWVFSSGDYIRWFEGGD
ncbi:MAG: hypothetical protein K9N51_13440 [Candidatus Pacebacteria bacterium]|nr:hypothetical protein [Candidatus Paceibacterota bacterium]